MYDPAMNFRGTPVLRLALGCQELGNLVWLLSYSDKLRNSRVAQVEMTQLISATLLFQFSN